ncbi:uncharacterized protein LOC108625584 [Ceratina calcarata]|uniref:Uncharacterized protein LOC108625584 n=1 Tax=Ceratina calcarata TaxID=156304 RepID=A0AAJ7S2U9_9HYME|nr:uncharacterized protein LOC108625584 [Ceratina calcarata]
MSSSSSEKIPKRRFFKRKGNAVSCSTPVRKGVPLPRNTSISEINTSSSGGMKRQRKQRKEKTKPKGNKELKRRRQRKTFLRTEISEEWETEPETETLQKSAIRKSIFISKNDVVFEDAGTSKNTQQSPQLPETDVLFADLRSPEEIRRGTNFIEDRAISPILASARRRRRKSRVSVKRLSFGDKEEIIPAKKQKRSLGIPLPAESLLPGLTDRDEVESLPLVLQNENTIRTYPCSKKSKRYNKNVMSYDQSADANLYRLFPTAYSNFLWDKFISENYDEVKKYLRPADDENQAPSSKISDEIPKMQKSKTMGEKYGRNMNVNVGVLDMSTGKWKEKYVYITSEDDENFNKAIKKRTYRNKSQTTKRKILRLQDVWRTCNKIRAAIFRVGFNLWDFYKPLDPNNNCLISESKFISVLAGPLKDQIGLADKEICDLADYFRVQDGRILYTQFCDIIHSSAPEFDKNKPLVTGLEWEDPEHVNRISATEDRKLCLILTQIAVLVNKRRLVLRPYFQDYELVSKNAGTVTFTHFGRILKFLGIVLASEEFRLLIKRFAKDAYTVNYVAFLKALDEVQAYFDKHQMLALGGELVDQFPGRIITAELPKLPRPEIGKLSPSKLFGKQSVFHPVMEEAKSTIPLMEVIRRIQRHILESRIRISEFFKSFDPLNAGKVTITKFRRGLDSLQISSIGRLYLAEPEIDALITLYKDPNDPDRVCWRTFEDDIDKVFTVKELEKLPNLKVEAPPKEIAELGRKGVADWQCEKPGVRELCEEALLKVRHRVSERRIFIKQFFKDYDRLNTGHVTRAQLRRILRTAALLLSGEEEFALEQRYNDDLGFNYNWFLQELEAKPIEEPLYHTMLKETRQVNAEKPPAEPSSDETNIVLILAKIKAKIVRDRIKVTEFMSQYDPRKEQVIKRTEFLRGLDQLRCNLSCAEMGTIMKVFQSPVRPEYVDYVKFGELIEEAVAMGSLERAPLLVPVQHVPSEASPKTFLNFDERHLATTAVQKLSGAQQPNLEELFKDYDKENIGTISKECLIKALSVRRMLQLISQRELDAMHKCFSVERGGRLELDYRAFLRAFYLMQENRKHLPF